MDMSMDMGIDMFQEDNTRIALIFWYIVAGFTGVVVSSRVVNGFEARSRLKQCTPESSPPTASRPSNSFAQGWATLTAIIRETRHPTAYIINSRFFYWLSPPPLGRSIVLLCYWLIVFLLATGNAVDKDAYYWERIGYRNAWVTMTQLPLVFLLASKTKNPLGLLLGVGHERLNWFHRWVGRTMLLTATLHGWFFYAEWAKADFVELEIEIMPMVKYGLGAWGILLWNVLTTIAPARNMVYELFVVQHIISIVMLLWCIHKHIPDYARYNLWWAIGVWAFDRAGRAVLYAIRNTRFTNVKRTGCNGKRRFGHEATAAVVGDNTTVLTLKSVHFKWTPGQYVYLWIPSLAPFEAHPYTLATAHRVSGVCTCNSVQLVVHKHNGFSKRLYNVGVKAPEKTGAPATFVAFVAGPYGVPPRWDTYENLVLIAASTGASFTLPILEAVIESKKRKEPSCTRRVDFVMTARDGEEINWYIHRLRQILSQSRARADLSVNIHVAQTGSDGQRPESPKSGGIVVMEDEELDVSDHPDSPINTRSAVQRRKTPMIADDIESGASCCNANSPIDMAAKEDFIKEYAGRLDIDSLIREPIEKAYGETSVVVCGGRKLTARVRNSVARLSDERAVHKGTGAQGIHLYVEEYSF